MTQTQAIRKHLMERGSLTPVDALNLYGCFRLAARIRDLRAEGLDVQTIKEECNGKWFARYEVRQ